MDLLCVTLKDLNVEFIPTEVGVPWDHIDAQNLMEVEFYTGIKVRKCLQEPYIHSNGEREKPSFEVRRSWIYEYCERITIHIRFLLGTLRMAMNLHAVYRRKSTYKSNSEQKPKPFGLQILGFLLLSQLPAVQSLLVEIPRNTAIWQRGSSEPIVMPCKSDNAGRLRWHVIRYPNSEKEVLFSGYNMRQDAKSYCTVMTDEPGTYHLLLNNTEEIAQTYICLEPGSLAEASADLIWIGSNLTCNDKSTEDLVNLTCSIEFRGNWAPTMGWKEYSNDREEVLLVKVNTTTIPNKSVTSTLAMPVKNGNINYTCTVKFDICDKPITTTATNVPHYEQRWRSSVSTGFQDEALPESVAIATIYAIVAVILIIIAVGIVFFINRRRRIAAKKEEEQKKKPQANSLLIATYKFRGGVTRW